MGTNEPKRELAQPTTPRSRRSILPGARRLWWTLLFFSLVPAGCSEDKNPVGFDQGLRGQVLVEAETVFVSEPAADVEIRPTRTTGSSLSILVGRDVGALARGLLRFETLPDTTGLRYAWLELHAKRGRGQSIGLEVRRILGPADGWDPDEVTWETAPAAADEAYESPQPVKTGAIAEDSLETLPRISLPMSMIRFWVEQPDSNAGLQVAVVPGESNQGIARIVSHNDVVYDKAGKKILTPALILADSSSTDIYRIGTTGDAYVTQDLRPVPVGDDQTANVSAGTPARFAVRFDLDAIVDTLPAGASIVRARLTLPLPENPISELGSVRLAVYEATEAWEEGDSPDTLKTLETASLPTYVATYSDAAATELTVELAALVQAWVEGAENHGVLVRYADETTSPEGIKLHTREGTRKPSLSIVYVVPLGFRWGEEE